MIKLKINLNKGHIKVRKTNKTWIKIYNYNNIDSRYYFSKNLDGITYKISRWSKQTIITCFGFLRFEPSSDLL